VRVRTAAGPGEPVSTAYETKRGRSLQMDLWKQAYRAEFDSDPQEG